MNRQFLLEVGLEEMPAHIVPLAIQQLTDKTKEFLKDERVSFESIDSFSTPRRLAIRINGLANKQSDIEEIAKGPAKKIAVDDAGEWTKAAIGFAKGQGADVSELFMKEVKGIEYVFVNKFLEGKPVEEILPHLSDVVANLSFPISMKWGEGHYRFIRPVHWVVALLDEQIIPMTLFGVASGNRTKGHRFLGEEITIETPEKYEILLMNQSVVVNSEKRQEMIVSQIKKIESENGYIIPIDPVLLEEVTNLVEYPTVFVGQFKSEYLKLPSEVLITSMKEHQRYFEVMDSEGTLKPYFVSVRNGNEKDLDNVIKGNQKVLQARLEDAEFFYKEDLNQSIEDYVERLTHVTFHEKIGNMHEKMRRVTLISNLIAKHIGLSLDEQEKLKRASEIYKFDLVTLMVGEFTELQGVIGERYALIKGENTEVAQAIKEHYYPKSSDGELPQSDIGSVLAVADKLDTLLTFFSVGLMPKGSNDPYALRRQAYGIIRIVENKKWNAPILSILSSVKNAINDNSEYYGITLGESIDELPSFIKGRMKQWFSGKQMRHDVIEAVLDSKLDNLMQMFKVADVLSNHVGDDSFKPTVESMTRVITLSAKSESDSIHINSDLFENQTEHDLYQAIQAIQGHSSVEDLEQWYANLTGLTPYIEAYFDQTMVMTDDLSVRNNRLNLLKLVAQQAVLFANLEKLVIK